MTTYNDTYHVAYISVYSLLKTHKTPLYDAVAIGCLEALKHWDAFDELAQAYLNGVRDAIIDHQDDYQADEKSMLEAVAKLERHELTAYVN